jgi:hypothetical protein
MAHHSGRNGSWGKNRDRHEGKQHNSARTKPGWTDMGKHTGSDRNRSGGIGLFDAIGNAFFGKKK